ncbi:MAG: chromosome segregation protein SMC, partial [Inquilinus sp.]|nr:chromosome segregation protein SMC [Inquilinus sp.]
MQFAKLRLSGFKSFVEPTELLIEPGITGVVGPNGCGKSNLVEALRWVMGESSAKRMRGAEMDDVIFGGTANLAPRNLAEVVLHLDNRGRTAPAAFNHHDELEVVRRIERGCGSDFRLNGKSVRARDLQLLFQDNSSGAHSSALVSQGRIGAIVSAKPADRRSLLEAAAGITGLHSRRHEAELRLKAAENNLVRLDDVIQAMEGQLANLKKQARQAARYRGLSDRIRKAEAVVLHLRWLAVQEGEGQARAAFQLADDGVRERMVAVTRATATQAGAAEAVPPLRQTEVEAAAALQRLKVAEEALEAERRRIEAARQDAERRLAQIVGDIDREKALEADTAEALTRLAEERDRLQAERTGETESETAARAVHEAAAADVSTHEAALNELTAGIAAAEAEARALAERVGGLETRLAGLDRRREEVAAQKATLDAEIAAAPDVAKADGRLIEAEALLGSLRSNAEAAEAKRQEAEAAHTVATDRAQAARGTLGKLTAEAEALTAVLDSGELDLFPPLIDSLTVESGYEMAFAAALGEDVAASLDEAAPVHWRALPPFSPAPQLPDGVASLAAHVEAPAALARRLSQTGLVPDEATGRRLSTQLGAGQQLVTRDGARWRWDGYTAAAEAPTAAAARLTQRNRLAALEAEIPAAAATSQAADDEAAAAREATEAARNYEKEARRAVDEAFAELGRARDQLARLGREAAARDSRLSGLADALAQIAVDREQAAADLETVSRAQADMPDISIRREQAQARRVALAEARAVQEERRNALDALLREAEGRARRLEAIAGEERSWQDRAAGTHRRIAELDSRAEEVREAVRQLEGRPAAIATEREALLSSIAEAEAKRGAAAESLARAENELAEADRELKATEGKLAEAREAR